MCTARLQIGRCLGCTCVFTCVFLGYVYSYLVVGIKGVDDATSDRFVSSERGKVIWDTDFSLFPETTLDKLFDLCLEFPRRAGEFAIETDPSFNTTESIPPTNVDCFPYYMKYAIETYRLDVSSPDKMYSGLHPIAATANPKEVRFDPRETPPRL